MSAFLLRLRRLTCYLGLTLPLMPVQAVLVLLRSPLADKLPRAYHRLTTRIMGFDVKVIGTRSIARPTLFVANHTSYLDIEMLGGVIEGSFIAKHEVAGWPLFGWLAKLQRTVFVDRRQRSTHRHRDAISERLAAGDNLILFPEGTSNDGTRVLPFKSALFSAVHSNDSASSVIVQPVSIAYVRLNGMPMGRLYRPFFAWYGDMEMASHLWALLGFGTVEVVVEFHSPLNSAHFPSRKALAEHCWQVTAAGVAAANAGRPQPKPEPPVAPIEARVEPTAARPAEPVFSAE
jgi:lyso-ornithine lipid O-acyltransferase